MKPVEIRDLLEMDFYGNLQARGKNVLFVKGHADQKNNDYTYDLMLCREGKIYQITDRKNVRSYVFEDKNTIWFVREENGQSQLYRMYLKGGEALCKATIDRSGVSILGFVDENCMALSYIQKAVDDHDLANDYEVLDESPWYENDKGFVSGQRIALATYDLESNTFQEIEKFAIAYSWGSRT